MTVISAVIRNEYFVVATDSIIEHTSIKHDGEKEKIISYESKYVCFPKLKCIISYWGIIDIVVSGIKIWDLKKWLEGYVNKQDSFDTVESFGIELSEQLKLIFNKHSWHEYRTLGIHLIGFEKFHNKMVPELFLIIADSMNNWNFGCSRRTYGDWKGWQDLSDDLVTQREEYFNKLEKEKGYSVYNNGDNEMFNIFFNSFHTAFKNTLDKKQLKGGLSKELFMDLAATPIKQISEFQQKYYFEGHQKVGGNINVVCMDKFGTFEIAIII